MHLIFIPIILRDHWSLVTVDMREMRIDFYYPSGGDGTRICEAIRLWLCDMRQGLRTVRAGRPPPPKPRRPPLNDHPHRQKHPSPSCEITVFWRVPVCNRTLKYYRTLS